MLVWTTAGYVVAGGERGENTGRVFVTTVRDGKTAPLRYISAPNRSAGEAILATDGSRVAIAWQEDRFDSGRPAGQQNLGTAVRAGILDATGVSIRVSSPERDGRHDWISSLAWDGCQFAFVHTNGLNPSGIQLVSFR